MFGIVFVFVIRILVMCFTGLKIRGMSLWYKSRTVEL